MAIVNVQQGTVTQPKQEPVIYDPGYRHSIVDSRYTPSTSLLSNVDGTPVLVEYYRAVLGASEEQIGLQTGNVPTYQSYTRIKNMILKFQGPEAFNFEEAKAEATAMVTAYILFDVAPILGDMFITDIGDGRAGIYQIIEAPRIKTFNVDKVYEVDCQLLGVVTQQIFDDLNRKVVQELVYSKDSALNGGNAIIAQSDFDNDKKLDAYMRSIGKYFLSNFLWESENTLCLPGGIKLPECDYERVYDPYLTEFAIDVLPLRLLGYTKLISRVGYDGYIEYGKNYQVTVWDLFRHCDWSILPSLKPEMWVKDRRDFFGTRMGGTFFDTKFDAIIINDAKSFDKVLPPYYGYAYNGQYKTAGTYKLPTYIFTDKFYLGDYGNEFEHLLLSVFRDNLVDKKKLLMECSKFYSYPLATQIYYAPLLIGMIIKSRVSNAGYV